jgi:hypothetical protein
MSVGGVGSRPSGPPISTPNAKALFKIVLGGADAAIRKGKLQDILNGTTIFSSTDLVMNGLVHTKLQECLAKPELRALADQLLIKFHFVLAPPSPGPSAPPFVPPGMPISPFALATSAGTPVPPGMAPLPLTPPAPMPPADPFGYHPDPRLPLRDLLRMRYAGKAADTTKSEGVVKGGAKESIINRVASNDPNIEKIEIEDIARAVNDRDIEIARGAVKAIGDLKKVLGRLSAHIVDGKSLFKILNDMKSTSTISYELLMDIDVTLAEYSAAEDRVTRAGDRLINATAVIRSVAAGTAKALPRLAAATKVAHITEDQLREIFTASTPEEVAERAANEVFGPVSDFIDALQNERNQAAADKTTIQANLDAALKVVTDLYALSLRLHGIFKATTVFSNLSRAEIADLIAHGTGVELLKPVDALFGSIVKQGQAAESAKVAAETATVGAEQARIRAEQARDAADKRITTILEPAIMEKDGRITGLAAERDGFKGAAEQSRREVEALRRNHGAELAEAHAAAQAIIVGKEVEASGAKQELEQKAVEHETALTLSNSRIEQLKAERQVLLARLGEGTIPTSDLAALEQERERLQAEFKGVVKSIVLLNQEYNQLETQSSGYKQMIIDHAHNASSSEKQYKIEWEELKTGFNSSYGKSRGNLQKAFRDSRDMLRVEQDPRRREEMAALASKSRQRLRDFFSLHTPALKEKFVDLRADTMDNVPFYRDMEKSYRGLLANVEARQAAIKQEIADLGERRVRLLQETDTLIDQLQMTRKGLDGRIDSSLEAVRGFKRVS